jgi:hypothetical protein
MKYYPIILLLLLVFAAGCSKQVGAGGTVVFSDNGTPVPYGSVIFSTPTFQSRSNINGQGRFTMGSYGAADGLPPGTYKVMIHVVDDSDADNPYNLLDARYTNKDTSGLEITVDKTVKNLEFRVDRNPKPKPKPKK